MRVDEFDFDLPENLIALRPIEPKHNARMLVVQKNTITDQHVYNLPDILTPKDILVFNDTKVLPAQLFGMRGDAHVECNLHKRISPIAWKAFVKKSRRLHVGDVVTFGNDTLRATITAKSEQDQIGEIELTFDVKPGELEAKLHEVGMMPLPPYIAARRGIDAKDDTDYQTIFAKQEGAVAAPTASLHYTAELLAALNTKNIPHVTLTLHVGAGTFLPVKADDTKDHKMHAEWGEISAATAARLNDVRKSGGRIVAVGTTVLRLLESAVDEHGVMRPFSGDTDIFITPGFQFRAVDILQTNFHLPRSTLFMLVSAFAGLDTMRNAYNHAIASQYRFYSYGDSSLLFRGRI
jgi:S-adenosylmethionine:tRNA ribosyltransferase-isomerase